MGCANDMANRTHKPGKVLFMRVDVIITQAGEYRRSGVHRSSGYGYDFQRKEVEEAEEKNVGGAVLESMKEEEEED